MCCLCINQHRVVEANKSGILDRTPVEFQNIFEDRVQGIGKLLCMMAPWEEATYLSRVWCIFEVFTALQNECEITIIMPPGEHDRMVKDIIGESNGGVDALHKSLAAIKVENAEASEPSDKLKILKLIEDSVGFAHVNNQVAERLRAWVSSIIDDVVSQHKGQVEDGSKEEDAWFLIHVGMLLKRFGNYGTALELCRKAQAIRETTLGMEHEDTAATYHTIARVVQGNRDGALEMYQKCLVIQEKVMGLEHPDTAASYNSIGSVLNDQGKYDEALKMHQKGLSIREKVLGVDHPDTACSYNNIGFALDNQGDNDGALEMYQKCLVIRQKVLGTEHACTAQTYNNIGGVLSDQVNYDGALDMYRKCLAIQEEVLGTEHLETAETYDDIGQGNFDCALEMSCY
jgi:Tfp pilus assembly protein PilF